MIVMSTQKKKVLDELNNNGFYQADPNLANYKREYTAYRKLLNLPEDTPLIWLIVNNYFDYTPISINALISNNYIEDNFHFHQPVDETEIQLVLDIPSEPFLYFSL